MSKIKNWVVDEKKHVRFYHDWNDKEVFIFETSCVMRCDFSVEKVFPIAISPLLLGSWAVAHYIILYYPNTRTLGETDILELKTKRLISFLQIDVLNKYLFLTSKPMIYLVNLSEKDYIRKKNKWLV